MAEALSTPLLLFDIGKDRATYALPKLVYPHQNSMGSMTMKKVCVPKLAEIAKYESSTGERSLPCNHAT